MAKLVSKTYGDALFELAVEEQALDVVMEEAKGVLDIITQNDDLIKLLNHPKITKEEKISVIETIFKGRCSDMIVGFLTTIVDKGRYNDITEIFTYFLGKVKDYKKIGVALVTSATALTDEQKESIKRRLLDTTDYISFEMNYEVKPEIIGGLVIRIGDRVLDSSIQTKISMLAKDLTKIQLA